MENFKILDEINYINGELYKNKKYYDLVETDDYFYEISVEEISHWEYRIEIMTADYCIMETIKYNVSSPSIKLQESIVEYLRLIGRIA